MPRHARRESVFFKELKRSVECVDTDAAVRQNAGCCEAGDEPAQQCIVSESQSASLPSHTHLAAAATATTTDEDDDDDDDDAKFTSLQSCMCLHFLSLFSLLYLYSCNITALHQLQRTQVHKQM